LRSVARYILLIDIVLFFAGCRPEASSVSRQLLGTTVTVTLSADEKNRDVLYASAFGEIEKVQKELNLYDPESCISIINRDAFYKPVSTITEVINIIDRSLEISEITDGAFDITFASTGKLWDFSRDEFTPPSDDAVKKKLGLVSYRNLRLDMRAGTVGILKKGTRIGLGGIAKGYATSRAVAILRNHDVKGAIVACAGDIQVIGSNSGRPWRAGIRDPRGPSVIGTLDMYDGEAVSTSGDYERFRIVKGRRYHHIIDPLTGYPADSGLVSVSVFSNDPVLCDGYSTAFFVLGAARSRDILKSMEELSVVMVDEDMKVYVSGRLKGRITFRGDLAVEYF